MDITKLIIPAAGFGTRFLPLTKSVPKEMIPLLSQPAIHYIVEEGIASGIEHFLIVTSRNKQALVNYLDASPELEYFLEEKNKLDCIASIEKFFEPHILRTSDNLKHSGLAMQFGQLGIQSAKNILVFAYRMILLLANNLHFRSLYALRAKKKQVLLLYKKCHHTLSARMAL